MSAIHVFQNGQELVGPMIIGATLHMSFDGPTTTWAWSMTVKPAASVNVVQDDSTSDPSFDPDAYGLYTLQFIDDASNVFTFALVAYYPIPTDLVVVTDDARGRADFMPDVTGVQASTRAIWGQSTDGANTGGLVEIAGGAGASSNGVRISERVLASIWSTYPIVRFDAVGGTVGRMTCYGGNTNQFLLSFDATVSIAAIQGSASTAIFYDAAGSGHVFRNYNGSTLGGFTNLQLQDNKVGFYGATPVVQATRPGQLTDSTTGTPSGTLVDVTTSAIADPAKCNNNFASLCDRLNKLETIVKNLGLSA